MKNAVTIRPVQPSDPSEWVIMRSNLWPDSTDNHEAELQQYFNGTSVDIEIAFVIETGGQLGGFLELNIRNFAEGSRESRVPYVEAWYVKDQLQGVGLGKTLMDEAEKWALSKGFHQLASDTEWHNERSIAVHKKLGFVEIDRVVCFLKILA